MIKNYTEYEDFEIDELNISKEAKEKIKEIKSNDEDKISSVTIIKKEKKVSITQPFVLAFTENLCALANLNISQNELKIITYVLKMMEFGNLINLNQTVVAKQLNLQRSNVSYNFKKLKQKGIFVENEGHLYMNSNLFTKGLSHNLNDEKKENLKKSKSDLHNEKGKRVKLEDTFKIKK